MPTDYIARIYIEYRKDFPALIDFSQAATIAHLPLGTVYDLSSRGCFDGFKHKVGRRRLLDLESFLRFILTQNPSQHSVQLQPVCPT